MSNRVEAIYEGGVLHPLEPLPFAEHEHVAITVDSLTASLTVPASQRDETDADVDYAFMARCQQEVARMGYSRTLEETRRLLSHVPGSFADLIIEERGDR